MATVCSVALLAQIPYVRVYIAAVIFKLRVSRQEAALGVYSSAAENVCHEVSGIAFGFKGMIIGIDIVNALHSNGRKIRKGFKLNGKYIDFLAFGDIRIGICRKLVFRKIFVISVGRSVYRGRYAVYKRVHKAF